MAISKTNNDVVVSSSALPTGAATSAAQTTGNSSLSSIDGKITAVNTGAVVVSSSALPSGAATSAKQDAANPSLLVAAIQATASGDTTLIASGTHKLRRIEASNSSTTTALTVGLKVPSLNSGATFGKKYLPASGGLAVWVFPAGYLQVTSEAVSVNLSAGGQIEVTAYYE